MDCCGLGFWWVCASLCINKLPFASANDTTAPSLRAGKEKSTKTLEILIVKAVGMEAAAEIPASLLRWVTPDETAAEFFRRQSREAVATGLPFIDAHVKLRPGNLLELAGPAGSAKSEMLLQVRVLCVLMQLARGLQ